MKTLLEAIRPTVLITPEKLRELLGLDITIATETFQHTGSFKFRAAYNLALNVPNTELVTASSGNFGQALACAARMLGKKCVVVMPSTSAQVKIDAVKSFGATVDLVDVTKQSRSSRLAEVAASMPNAYVASPYDDPFVIDGNSTLATEIAGFNFDVIVAPVGGGGLLSGISKGLCVAGSQTEVVGAEPLLANDAARSLKAGEILANESEPQTMADGARTVSVGKHNWEIIKAGVKTIVEVSEESIAAAMRHYYGLVNLKCEPTGALALGAVLERPELFEGKKICLIVSGGNVDPAVYSRVIGG